MTILLLNQTFHPDIAATAQQASDLATKLVERGHDVMVLCGRRAYDNDQRDRYARQELWRGVRVCRIASLGLGKKARWRRAADFASYIMNCALRLAVLPRVDLVIAMTSPPLISWLGAIFTTLKGGRLVFWVMDLNPDEALAAGWLRPGSWTSKRLLEMLDFSLRRATTIVALDRFMAERIVAKGVSPAKVVTLPPWAYDHVVHYDVDGRERFRKQHGLWRKHVVMYSGNHSPCHPLETLLEAARDLKKRDDIAFCFIGGGSEFDTVRKFKVKHTLNNIVTLPYQPLEKLSASLSAADLHVVVMGASFVGIVHPCKVYNIRLLGIPYLYIGPSESHVSEMGPTWIANHGAVDDVVRHIAASAASGERWRPNARISRRHDQLVAQMVLTVEGAVSD